MPNAFTSESLVQYFLVAVCHANYIREKVIPLYSLVSVNSE